LVFEEERFVYNLKKATIISEIWQKVHQAPAKRI